MKKNVIPRVVCLFLFVLTGFAQQKRHIFKGEDTETFKIQLTNQKAFSESKAFIHKSDGLAVQQKTQETPEFVLKPQKITLKKPKPFISAYTAWEGKNLDYTTIQLSYRTSRSGRSWTNWKAAVFDGHLEQTSERIISKMEFLDKRVKYIQYKVSLLEEMTTITISNVQLFHYSPGETPKKIQKQIRERVGKATKAACAKPPVVSRSLWGAIFRNPAPTSVVSHLIVHHEFGSNISSDWAARVRSIQNFHINGNGWSDIGYNFLVDPNGVIYEGRAGGDNAIGAHFCARNRNTMGVCMLGDYSSVTPTTATQNSLKSLLAWKADKENINPIGSSFHYSINSSLTHIAGHRDAGCSVCPGNGGYATLGSIRSGVNSLVANGCSGGTPPPSDTTPPTTSISAVGGSTQTDDFMVNFTDNDNVGVTRRYYQVLEKYGSSFLANRRKGFFNENFDQDFGVYDKGAGSWSVTDGRLMQTNTTSDNTLWSSYLIQDSGLPYLYEFAAKLTSTTGPRKFGIHIMSSDGTLSQRGNSYLIWFSGEDNKVRIYETVNNVLYFRAIADVSLDNNWAKYRVTYSPAYGVLQIWKNNEYLLNWTDSSPINSGVAISLRTNKTAIEFDDLKVYKYRDGSSVLVTAGASDNTKDLRTTSGKIKSMVRDDAGNWSSPGNLDITMNFGKSFTQTQNTLTLYPNEVTDRATIKWTQPEYGVVNISVFDLQGKPVAKMPKDYMDKGRSELDISPLIGILPSGLYLLKLTSGSYRETIRMIKK